MTAHPSQKPALQPHGTIAGRTNDVRDLGEEPMTPAQASHLQSLCAALQEPELFTATLTKVEASRRIDMLLLRRDGG